MRYEVAQVIRQDKAIELVYGNNDYPRQILGRHMISDGQVISAFHPDAVRMSVIDEHGKSHEMDPVEKLPVYAAYFPTKRPFPYKIAMTFKDGNSYVSEDPYEFDGVITSDEEKLFMEGKWKNSYEKLGAHPMKIHGVQGVYFAVWAPDAKRVSVVGDFNFWNGMIYPMNRRNRSGIFELFIPKVKNKALYRFEIKSRGGMISQKLDPAGSIDMDGSGDTSIVLDYKEFIWTDQQWMKDRCYKNWKHTPFAVCDREILDYNQETFLENGCFTHVILKTPTYCHGVRGKIREWINELHHKKVGVILQISLGLFSLEDNGLKYFDGTSLYGHSDERIHFDSRKQMARFHHNRKEVNSYLLSYLIFWIREYHIDGFIFEGISEMIYPSYMKVFEGRKIKEVIYQKETEEFICMAANEVKREDSGVLLIADESKEAKKHNLELIYSKAPFDALINYSVSQNLGEYMKGISEDIPNDYYKLTQPLMKNGLRNTVLNIDAKNIVDFGDSYANNIFLNEYDRKSWHKLTMGYMMGAPGRKRWSWKNMESAAIQNYLKKLFQLYLSHDCMYSREPMRTSFSWINGMDAKNSILSFVRRSPREGDGKSLLFICNFSRRKYEGHRVGVPEYGEYRLLLNSDSEEFGGAIRYDDDVVLNSSRQEWDLQPYSLRVTISALSVLIFEY